MVATSSGQRQAARQPPAAATTSRKRKADPNLPKFYAVRSGYKPGIYMAWPDCQAQIAGFKGAQFKSFTTREDAAAFVAGKTPPSEAALKGKPDKFYAVAKGRKPGIYTDWSMASEAITGTKGPKYKKFATRAEAQAFMRLYGDAATVLAMEGVAADGDEDEDDDEEEEDDDEEDDEDDEEEDEDDEEEDLQPVAKKVRTTGPSAAPPAGKGGELINVYTDGSSLGNGYHGASAGVGVFFGSGDPRNISERLRGDPQTNQRAELTAILRALEVVPTRQGIQIITDSKYSIQCVTEWYRNWERNGWKTQQGPVKNRDLVEAVRAKIKERDAKKAQTLFTWVKGHASDPGNVAADHLAVQGARGM